MNTKNIIIRIVALVVFVMLPAYIVVKTPILKQFYCSKKDNLCILRVYNTFDKEPSTSKDVKLSDIKTIQKGSCKTIVDIKEHPCISVETLDTSYVLDYSMTDEDVDIAIKDFKNYIKDPKVSIYKLVADKTLDEVNIQLTFWGVIIMMGLLIASGIIRDNKKLVNLHKTTKNDNIEK